MIKKGYAMTISIVALLIGFTTQVASQTIHVSLRGKPQPVLGKPIHWDAGIVAVMGRDGQLFTFSPEEAETYHRISNDFRSYSQADIRGELMREFGQGYEVSGTGQFLVVHPAGERDVWAKRFEDLFRSMHVYIGARGIPWQTPKFPFIAVVFPTQQHYMHFAQAQGTPISSQALGYYDPVSNRIYMYDVTAGRNGGDWHTNAETIIHEAAHQTAFNVGIHRRFAEVPRWIIEGLGTLFEARGVWDSRHHPNRIDRVNLVQQQAYLRTIDPHKSLEILKYQVATDEVFKRSTSRAYAHAWALTFFLTEQYPRDYARYLAIVNRQPNFDVYTPTERMRDFKSAFGQDLTLLNAKLQRFVADLTSDN